MNREIFQSLVRRILNEEVQKRVPEMNGNGVDDSKKNRTFASDSNSRDSGSKEDMYAEISKAVKGIDPLATVVWDDHDDVTINGRDIISARITPLWEDNFKIVFMPRNEDRYFFTGLTWKQVVEFVKENLDNKNHHTSIEKARDKSWRNAEDQTDGPDKGLPQKDKPKAMKVGDTKNKDKRYNEKFSTNEDDLPNKPLRPVGEFKKTLDYKVKDPVKLRKKVPDKKLIVKPK